MRTQDECLDDQMANGTAVAGGDSRRYCKHCGYDMPKSGDRLCEVRDGDLCEGKVRKPMTKCPCGTQYGSGYKRCPSCGSAGKAG